MTGLEKDTELLRALAAFTGLPPSVIATEAGLADTTISRPFKGSASTRLSAPTLDKLRKRFPDFPGWLDNNLAEPQLGFLHQPPERRADMVSVAGIDLNFGLGSAIMDEEIVEHQAEPLLFPAAWLRQITTTAPEHLYWTSGLGNSMEPAIGDGDVILIDRSKVGSAFGDLYWAIAYGQTGMIKRLRPMPDGSVKILSDNPSVPPELAYDGELNVFGRVVAVVRKL
jgi:Peptidase S24-like